MYRVIAERAVEGIFDYRLYDNEAEAYNAADQLYQSWKFLHSIDFARPAVRICVINASGDIIFRFGNI